MSQMSAAQIALGGMRCATCIFFAPNPFNRGIRLRGQCRRHAPQIDMQGPENRPRSIWPMVDEDAYCGEHSTLEEELGDERAI